MSEIKLVGHAQLTKKLQENMDMEAVKRVVLKNGNQLEKKMKEKAGTVFVKGYTTGETARNINTELSDGELTATVKPTMDYDPYVEFGTRRMEAEPFVKPAWEEQVQQFKQDMKKVTR